MAQNLRIEPKTRDYVLENGSPIPSDRVLEAGFIALNIPQGKYLYGSPDQGSLLWTLQNQLRDSSIDQRFNAYATDAIKRQLVDRGLAKDVLARNVGFSRTTSENEIDIQAADVQVSNQFSFISVG